MEASRHYRFLAHLPVVTVIQRWFTINETSHNLKTFRTFDLFQLLCISNKLSDLNRTGKTLIFLIKSNLGPGLFAIPAAFKDAGLMGGSIGIPLMVILSIHCMHMLVKCTQVLKTRKGDSDMAMDYSQAIEEACLTGPPFTKKYARFARLVLQILRSFNQSIKMFLNETVGRLKFRCFLKRQPSVPSSFYLLELIYNR